MGAGRTRKIRAARRRNRRLARVTHDLTDTQWAALREAWGGCAYCGANEGPLQRDCILPITRGGRYTLTNVVPACPPCNTSKCNDEVTAWLRRKRFDERGSCCGTRGSVPSSRLLSDVLRPRGDAARPMQTGLHVERGPWADGTWRP